MAVINHHQAPALPPLDAPPGIDLHDTRQRGAALALKRLVDLSAASLVLVLLAPILAFAALSVRLTSPGPILHRQTRVGRFGQQFTVYKFRSMAADADPGVHEAYVHRLMQNGGEPDGDDGGEAAVFKVEDDPRITRVGHLLRRTSIDELPQLFNVLKGEMSLVGPRPDVPYALADYEDWHWRRFSVLPGMTGLWQVSGRGCLPPLEMLRLDVTYADTWSLRQDVSILLRTIPIVLAESGSR